ncbi:MAG: helix-hairpin-helix domain-containing protein, partial [Chitinophagaceae bacterium]|nr:helix-hairpin-helix domain-containing protein [Chitinophagaceae bacterium]
GMTDSNFFKFRGRVKVEKGFTPTKIQINKASYQEMRRHPYIHHLFAKSVLAYIQSHASISDLEALLAIGSLSKDEVLKVAPYLDFRL